MKRFLVLATVVACVGFTSSAFAQQRGRGGFGFGSGGVAGLLAIEEVRSELKVTPEQAEKLQALRGSREDREALQNLSREERQKRYAEMAKKAEDTVKTVLDETQQKRLEELRIQRDGAESLTRAEVAEKLGLEQAQKDKIKQIAEAGDSNRDFDFQNATQEERQKFFTEARERREKRNTDLLAVLTDAQKQSFEKMHGAKFTFPERRRNNNNN
jgi:hypothetical protein